MQTPDSDHVAAACGIGIILSAVGWLGAVGITLESLARPRLVWWAKFISVALLVVSGVATGSVALFAAWGTGGGSLLVPLALVPGIVGVSVLLRNRKHQATASHSFTK
jgi:hypothetical protein